MYEITPLRNGFGAFVTKISLANHLNNSQMQEKIKEDLYKHRLLIFKDQGKLSAEAQLTVSKWFGKIESTFYRHPKSPHKDIFRVSNDPKEGCTNVGRSGWHIDGTFMREPFKVQTMHFWSVSQHGTTHFAPLKELVEELPKDKREIWDKLWFGSNHSVIHPLVYRHPVTKDLTMCFHCGEPFVECFLENYDRESSSAEKIYSWDETLSVLSDITQQLESSPYKYSHIWELGDFALMDNLAIAHFADPGTQLSSAKDGLRILHRTTVAGDHGPPQK